MKITSQVMIQHMMIPQNFFSPKKFNMPNDIKKKKKLCSQRWSALPLVTIFTHLTDS